MPPSAKHVSRDSHLTKNRRDAIFVRFNLGRLDFQPFYEDTGDYIAIIVPDLLDRYRQGRALGFIKYYKPSGYVTIINSVSRQSNTILTLLAVIDGV